MIRTIVVFEQINERLSTVLDKFGEPFLVENKVKMGFNLTPKKDQDAGKT